MVAEQLGPKTELILEQVLDDNLEQRLDKQTFMAKYDDKINGQMAAGLGRLGAGVVSLLAGQDVNVSIQTATTAVENNFIPAVIGIGLIGWEAYDIYCTGRDEGLEAAALKLGFDVVTAAVGGTVFKLGGKVVAHTASGAIQHYKQLHPVFAKLYDQAAKVIARGVDKVRQFDARLDNIVHTATGRITERLGIDQTTRQISQQVGKQEAKETVKQSIKYTEIELKIINEARNILHSEEFSKIRSAHILKKPIINIDSRIIQYEPGLPASGMTMFGENGFVIGREAFISQNELHQTILHELYRLNTSEMAGGVSSSLATKETMAAANFAAKALKDIK